MHAAPDGSVIQRDTPGADLIAFEIKDKITKSDIEWMSSITDGAMKAHVRSTCCDHVELRRLGSGAKFDGYANEVKVRSVAHIHRYVVVGAPTFARAMIKLSGTVIPVETKAFDLAEEAAAWAYLAEAGPAAGLKVLGSVTALNSQAVADCLGFSKADNLNCDNLCARPSLQWRQPSRRDPEVARSSTSTPSSDRRLHRRSVTKFSSPAHRVTPTLALPKGLTIHCAPAEDADAAHGSVTSVIEGDVVIDATSNAHGRRRRQRRLVVSDDDDLW